MSSPPEAKRPRLEDVLLPTCARPSHYKLELEPRVADFAFSGTVEVSVEILRDTDTLTLHAVELEVPSGEWRPSGGGEPISASSIRSDERQQTLAVVLPQTLRAGSKGVLRLAFAGELTSRLCGLYRSRYTVVLPEGTTEERWMVVTQFEATDARRAFPCWDEPALKASFALSVVIPRTRTAVSNMPAVSMETLPRLAFDDRHPNGNEVLLQRVRFADTPVMSTYLLALVVGEFDAISARTPSGVELRVYTPLGRAELARHALGVAERALPYFEAQYGEPFPLPKLDLLAIPDFAAGAMENWGAITYRETKILLDPARAALADVIRGSRTICHELAHMWFGNLVTMQWWTHLWLNEGFARFMEFRALDHIFPEWGVWDIFLSDVFREALRLDGLESTHPVEVPVSHPDEIDNIFDAISYAKGASVIRMLCDFLGEETFMRGICRYLSGKRYGNAVTEDLWTALAASAGQDVGPMMDSFVKQPGYPVLTVHHKAGRLQVSQQRFLQSGGKAPGRWTVPVRWRTEAGEEGMAVIGDEEGAVRIPDGAGWIKLNWGQVGFYRVNLAPDMLEALKAPLASRTLPARDRLGLLSDALAMSAAGLAPPGPALDLVMACVGEQELPVVREICGSFRGLLALYQGDEELTSLLRTAMVATLKETAAACGWRPRPSEPQRAALVRAEVFAALVAAEEPGACQEALGLFGDGTAATIAGIPSDLRLTVFRAAASRGTTCYEALRRIYTDQSTLVDERKRVLQALGRCREKHGETLAWALNSGEVRDQDIGFALDGLASSDSQGLWVGFTEQWPTLEARFMQGQGFMISSIVTAVTQGLKTEADAEAVQRFFAQRDARAARQTVEQQLEKIRNKAARTAREGPALLAHLRAASKP